MTDAYERGQRDFNAFQNENPYEDCTEEAEDWIEGWQQQWYAALDEEF